jgi:hypothetical protein
LRNIGFKIINLDCVIGRRGITIQLPPSSLAKLIILKPIATTPYYISKIEIVKDILFPSLEDAGSDACLGTRWKKPWRNRIYLFSGCSESL